MARSRVPFGQRYATSKAIFGQSWSMLRSERDLWVFPLLGTAALLVMLAVLFVPLMFLVFLAPHATVSVFRDVPGPLRPFLFLLALPLTYPFAVLASLFNAALCFAAHERMEGRPGLKMDAWQRAVDQLGPIARFNLLAMLVAGVLGILGQLLDRLRIIPYIGQAVQTLGRLAWAVAAYFVIPILVIEGERSAIGALRTSTGLAREQWGKATAGIVTIGLAILVPMLLLLVPMLLLSFGGPVLIGMGVVSWKLWLPLMMVVTGVSILGIIVLSAFAGMVGQLYQVALYRFARTGIVSLPFTPETVVDAWALYRKD